MKNKQLYLEYAEFIGSTGLAESTKKTYLNHVRHLYSWAEFFDKDLQNLSIKEIIEYKSQLKKIYADSTINNKLSAVRNFYDFLIQVDIVKSNIVFNSLFITINKIRPQFLSEDDREKLIEFLSSKGQHVQLAFNIMMYAGLRLSEVTEIKIKDLEFREEKVYIHVYDFKTNKLRLCPIFSNQTTLDIKEQIKNKVLGDKLFDLAPRTLQHYAKEFADKYNIKFSVHTCRHIFATDRVRNGIRIELLKTLMGHKSINTTLLYIYIAEEEIYSLLI